MSLLFTDGFDDGLTFSGKWTQWTSPSACTYALGRNGNGLQITNVGHYGVKQLAAADEHATLIVGAAMKYTTVSGTTLVVCEFWSDANTTQHTRLLIDGTSGALSVYRGGALLATSAQSVVPNNWYYIEFKATLGDAGVGAYDVHVNGVTWLSATGVDTKNAGTKTVYDTVRLLGYNGAGGVTYDDFYICNAAGSTNNNFLGDIAIETILPSGAGNSTQFTPTTSGSNYQTEVAADAPIGYWRLGESSGTNAADSSGNGRNGTYTNSPTLGATGLLSGNADTAVQFDGVNDYVDLGDLAAWDVTNITYEAWIKTSSSAGTQTVIGSWTNSAGENRASLRVISGTPQAIFYVGTSLYTISSLIFISDNLVHHLAFTFNGTAGILYLDGTQIGVTNITGNLDGGSGIAIGRRHPTASAEYFNGVIDEVAVYSTALSPLRIITHYNVGTAQTANYQMVDDPIPKTADYVSSSTVGNKDTYAMTNLVRTVGNVKGVAAYAYANKSDSGARTMKVVARSSSSETDSSTKTLATTNEVHAQVYETDPNGGGAWTISSVNGAEFGVKVDS